MTPTFIAATAGGSKNFCNSALTGVLFGGSLTPAAAQMAAVRVESRFLMERPTRSNATVQGAFCYGRAAAWSLWARRFSISGLSTRSCPTASLKAGGRDPKPMKTWRMSLSVAHTQWAHFAPMRPLSRHTGRPALRHEV